MSTDLLTGVYKQLELQANKSAIQQLLRVAHSIHRSVNISGSKPECIRALQQAVDARYIDYKDVLKLLWSAEENGQQQILMYRPANDEIRDWLADPSNVGDALFGEDAWDWGSFPVFNNVFNGIELTDFRRGLPGRPNDWLIKFYTHGRTRRPLGNPTVERPEADVEVESRRYKVRDVHCVHSVRWRSPRVLEFRIDLNGLKSDEIFANRLKAVWGVLEPAFTQDDVLGRPVDRILANILDHRLEEENADSYTVGELELVDPGSGYHRVIPSEAEPFDAEPARQVTLRNARAAGMKPSALQIKWKKNASTPEHFPNTLQTSLNKTKYGPILTIRRRASYEDLEYVFQQLSKHSRKTP